MPNMMIWIIAVSLSMDAFSLSLAYGTLNLSKKNMWTLSIIVGIYHFLMPLLGMAIGNVILRVMPIKPEYIVSIVLIFIGIEMVIGSFKKDDSFHLMSFIELLLFGLAVSLDSFSVGIGIRTLTSHIIPSSLTFSLSAFAFTYLGLYLGKKINDKIGFISTLIGGIALAIIGIIYAF